MAGSKGGTKKGVILWGNGERGLMVMNQSMVNLQYGIFKGGLLIGGAPPLMLERKRGMVVANQSMVNHVRFNGIPKMGVNMRVREGVLIARNQSLVNPW
jgi:hypothetical protein